MSSFRLVLPITLTLAMALSSSCGGVTSVPPPEIEKTLAITQDIQTVEIKPTSTENLPENIERIYDVTISRDKKSIAVFTSKGIYIYDSTTLTQQQFIVYKSDVSPQNFHLLSPSITFSPDGSKLIFSSKNWIASWDLINQSENDNLFLSISAIPEWAISQIEYSPKGDRIMVTTYGGYDNCDGTGVNFALYDIEFNLLFDRYFCTAYLENYYRFTSDNHVYIFYNVRSMFFPLEFYNVELSTGNVIEKVEYNPYSSGNVENFIYDVSPDGKLIAIGNYSNYQFSTIIVDANSGSKKQHIDGGIDFSLEGIGKLRKSNAEEIINEKCSIINKADEGKQYATLTSNDSMAVFTISDWYPFADWKDINSLELWDLSICKIEKTIIFP